MDLGINLLVAEHGGTPGSPIGTSYEFPSFEQIDYYAAKGFTHIRLPMPWERLQGSLFGELDAAYVAKVQALVTYANGLGLDVVLDVHNYGAYEGQLIGSDAVPVSAFTDLWGKLGAAFADQENVRFGLMNESQVASAETWLDINNEAIAAIRAAGANQQILVSGIDWQAANRFMTNGNADLFGQPGAIVDPANNFAIELHQYLDDTSGQNAWVVSETIGVERLTAVTEWAREHGYKLYLGEFAVADNPTALTALDNMLAYVQANSDVWQSAAYWGGGAGWTDYMFSPNPDLGILDVAQMDVLEQHTGATYVSIVQADGTVRTETHLPDRSTPSMVDVLSSTGELISRTIYSVDGAPTHTVSVNADGGYSVTSYSNLPTGVAEHSVEYDAKQLRVGETVVSADGSKQVSHFEPGAHDAFMKDIYNVAGVMIEQVTFGADGIHSTTLNDGRVASVDHYTIDWQFLTRSTYDADGTLIRLQTLNADGTNTVAMFDGNNGVIVSTVNYTAEWQQTSNSSYDKSGNLIATYAKLADGSSTIERFVAGETAFSTKEVYNAAGKLVSSVTNHGVDGFINVTYAATGQVLTKEVYDAHWVIESRTTFDAGGKVASLYLAQADGTNLVQTFTAENQSTPTSIDHFTSDGKIITRTYLDTLGNVASIDHVNADGTHRVEYFTPGIDIATAESIFSADWQLQSHAVITASTQILRPLVAPDEAPINLAAVDAPPPAAPTPPAVITVADLWEDVSDTPYAPVSEAGHAPNSGHGGWWRNAWDTWNTPAPETAANPWTHTPDVFDTPDTSAAWGHYLLV